MPDFRVERLNTVLSPPVGATQLNKTEPGPKTESFSDILAQEINADEGIRFSKHALSRLDSRDITLNRDDLQKLGEAVDKASQKGVRDSLVLMNDLAFIVSVPGRTVVTAMHASEAKENVFTNIDGAVIL